MKITTYLLPITILLASCATQKDVGNIATRMEALEKQNSAVAGKVEVIEKQTSGMETAVKATLTEIQETQKRIEDVLAVLLRNQADVKLDQDALTMKLNTVVANLDENAHYLKQVDEKLKKLEDRIRELQLLSMESSMVSSQRAEASRKEIVEIVSALSSQVGELGKPSPDRKQEKKKGALPPAPEAVLSEPSVAELAPEAVAPAPEATPPAPDVTPAAKVEKGKADKRAEKKIKIPKNISADDLYGSAYKNYLKGDYQQALAEFGEHVKRYPNTDLSYNSQYWMGEALANQGKLKEAADAFILTAKNYPRSTKAPTALWRASEILGKLGFKEEVQAILVKIHDNYPASYEAVLAEEKLKAIEEHGK